ncbi:MAG: protein translocase subunit SecD [Patescibacteria group bacterium]
MKENSPQTETFLRFFKAAVVLVIVGIIAWFINTNALGDNPSQPFKLGLDLAGGSHLVYEADVTKIDPAEVPELMAVLREVVERRVNAFGVSEPVVQVEKSSIVAERESNRLVVELPGVTDVKEAIKQIGETPLLEFKLLDPDRLAEQQTLESLDSLVKNSTTTIAIGNAKVNGKEIKPEDPYIDTGLTGRYLETASLEFANGQGGQVANEPLVTVKFNEEGAKLFADITRANVGRQLGIFLDGELLSSPVINEAITGGTAVISGQFTVEEAKTLSKNLSFGALPVPITLASTQTIDATLGAGVIDQITKAGLLGFTLIALFLIFWYRGPGVVAVIALASYVLISLLIFMLVPVTLTAAGLAGLVLSLGMAVDANVLVFERMKEEYLAGKSSQSAIRDGFDRAWSAIRDGNVTALLSAVILFWFGNSLIKGFALVLGIGTVISIVSAITITRALLLVLPDVKRNDVGLWPWLFKTGITKK